MFHPAITARRHRPLRRVIATGMIAAAAATAAGPVQAATTTDTPASAPTSFALPTGFQPEGIDTGELDGHAYAFVTSLADGSIYRADLATGVGSVLSPPADSPSIGAELDTRARLFVADGPGGFVNGDSGGGARVIDARTGKVLAKYRLTKTASLVNDVTVTRDAVWFTDTLNPVLYELPLGKDGELPAASEIKTVPITGADRFDDKASTVDGNGIASTPDHKALIIINYRTGKLYRFDPKTGATRRLNISGGKTFPMGDGLTVDGNRLYVPQNTNKISVLALNSSGTSGHLLHVLRSSSFDGPTNVARSGRRLWTVSAHFKTITPKTTAYTVSSVQVP